MKRGIFLLKKKKNSQDITTKIKTIMPCINFRKWKMDKKISLKTTKNSSRVTGWLAR